MSLHGHWEGEPPGSRLSVVWPGLPLLMLAGYWVLALVLDWYGRCFLLRLPLVASFAFVCIFAVGVMALLGWLMLFAPAARVGMWLVLLPSGVLLLGFLLAFRLSAWRAGTGLRLGRGGGWRRCGTTSPAMSAWVWPRALRSFVSWSVWRPCGLPDGRPGPAEPASQVIEERVRFARGGPSPCPAGRRRIPRSRRSGTAGALSRRLLGQARVFGAEPPPG